MEQRNRIQTGKLYEEKAVLFLKEQGFFILERNFRCRQGEIDIIGTHEKCLVFVEVKYRRDEAKGTPEEAVGLVKQQKICRTSDYYRSSHKAYYNWQVRYDVIAMTGKNVKWYQNAFPYLEKGNRQCW